MNEQFGGSDASGIINLKKGEIIGNENEFGSVHPQVNQVNPSIESVQGDDRRRLYFNDITMKSYDWTCYMREILIELQEVDQFRFKAMFHWIVETPVAAAQDHLDWADDVTIDFTLYTSSGAFITSFTHYYRRGCGRYLHEVPDVFYTSQVAHPIINLGSQVGAAKIGGSFRLRVTAC